MQLSNKVKCFVHCELAPLSGSTPVLQCSPNDVNQTVLGGGDGTQVEVTAAAAV